MSGVELASARWFKSSRSANNGSCVECAFLTGPAVAVRDSKDPHGPALLFGPAEWRAFLNHMRTR
jgi:hypothetical protein